MQCSVDKFSIACTNFGLTISIKKTEVLHQPAPGKPYVEPNITVNGQRLSAVNRFTYLGSTLSQNATIDDEVNVRTARASVIFGRLHANVWNRRGISIQTKLKVYRAIVLPTLLYACETWTVYQRHAKKLNHFHTTCLRKLLNIKWQDRIPDTEVLAQADLPSIYTILMQSQLRWTGHVARMPDHRLPKRLFIGELQQGKRSHGGQRKRFRHSKNIPESVCHHPPRLLGTNSYGPGHVAFLRAQRLQDMRGQQDRCSRAKEASQESPSQQSAG